MHAPDTFIIDNTLTSYKAHLPLLQLGQNEPMPVRARRGMVVCCLSGELWVTHEGDSRDYIVPRGHRYCCSEDSLIVANSLDGPSTALVYWTDPERCPEFATNGVHADFESTKRLVRKAQELRINAMNRFARKFVRVIHGVWCVAANGCSKAGDSLNSRVAMVRVWLRRIRI